MITIPKWSGLRGYGNSVAVRITIIMPIIGYLLLLNEQVVAYSRIDPRFSLFTSDRPWRLIFLYYGSLATGLAAILYQWRCPIIVKKYDSPVEYLTAELNFFSDEDNYEYIRARVRARFAKAPERLRQLEGVRHIEGKLSKIPEDEVSYRSHVTHALTAEWHMADNGDLWARGLFCIVGGVGALLLALPSILTLVEVTLSLGSAMQF